jgi:hypothetical protein
MATENMAFVDTVAPVQEAAEGRAAGEQRPEGDIAALGRVPGQCRVDLRDLGQVVAVCGVAGANLPWPPIRGRRAVQATDQSRARQRSTGGWLGRSRGQGQVAGTAAHGHAVGLVRFVTAAG